MSGWAFPIMAVGIVFVYILTLIVGRRNEAKERERRERLLHIHPQRFAGGFGLDVYYQSEQDRDEQ